MTVLLPKTFEPTHPTSGLPDFPAIDVFGKPGEPFQLNVQGKVHRLSGHPCSEGGKPGGAYGRSIYVDSADGRRFLTHINAVRVKVGDTVTPTTVLGTICDSAVSHKPGTSHIHYGFHREPNPMPVPTERLYDVTGPLGHSIARHQTAAKVTRNVAAWVKTHGLVTIRHADG